MLPQQLEKLKLPEDDTRYCTMLHTLPRLLSPHSTVLGTGHVCTPGTASKCIPAAVAWHRQDEASRLVAPAPSAFAHLCEGFRALPSSMQQGKGVWEGVWEGVSPSSSMQWGNAAGSRLLQPSRFWGEIHEGELTHLAPPKTPGCFTSPAHLYLCPQATDCSATLLNWLPTTIKWQQEKAGHSRAFNEEGLMLLRVAVVLH